MRLPFHVIARNTALKKAAKLVFLAGILGLSAQAGAAPAGGSGKFYCCTEAAGTQVCGDILPQSCYGRAYRELGQTGQTLREVAPPLTAEQRAQRTIEDEQRKEAEARQKEQQRKDQALLNTYASAEDIEAMRKRALEDIDKSIKRAESRIVEIRAARKKFEDEAEFYKKKTLPPDIRKGLRDADFEIKSQESIVEAKKKETDVIQAKYDEDRARFLDLQRRKGVR